MKPTDIGGQLETLPETIRTDLAEAGRQSLYFFANHILGYRLLTEDCHGMVSTWYQQNPKRFKLIMMPRGHYKSTLFTIAGTLWQVVRDPNLTHLIVNEAGRNASRFLQTIRSHAEHNRLFRTLYGHIVPRNTKATPQWNNDSLLFVRDRHCPEPTIDALGIDGTATSQHYNHIVFDDVISEKAAQSVTTMQSTIETMKSILPLVVNRDSDPIDFIGTHWTFNDVYVWVKKAFGDALGKLILPVIDSEGRMLVPGLMSKESLAIERRTMGSYLFSCLMLNNPRDEEHQDLNVRDLRYWEWASGNPDSDVVVCYDGNGNEADRWHLGQLDITTTVDLAPAEKLSSDRNAIVTVGVSPKAQAIVLDAHATRDKAYHVLDYLFKLHDRYRPRKYGIENVAYQAAFKHFVEQRGLDEGKYLTVIPVKPPGGNKSHVRGLQPVMAVGRLFVHAQQHILLNEMADYPLGEHDDCIDALALQQQIWRGVLGPAQRLRNEEAVESLVRASFGRTITNAPVMGRDPDDDPEWKPGYWTTDRRALGI